MEDHDFTTNFWKQGNERKVRRHFLFLQKYILIHLLLAKMCLDTVWKFHDFSITQILREINFWDSTGAKSAILTHLL